MSQYQKSRHRQSAQFATGKTRHGARLITGIVVILVVLAAFGVFDLVLQHNASSSNQGGARSQGLGNSGVPFSVTFTGPVSGPLAIGSVNLCGPQQGTSTYEVDASGTINHTSYDFTLIIPKYQQPGTYSTAGGNATAAVALVNTGTMDSWGSQGQQGSATVNSDGQAGTITATMVDSSGKALEKVTGTWSCG